MNARFLALLISLPLTLVALTPRQSVAASPQFDALDLASIPNGCDLYALKQAELAYLVSQGADRAVARKNFFNLFTAVIQNGERSFDPAILAGGNRAFWDLGFEKFSEKETRLDHALSTDEWKSILSEPQDKRGALRTALAIRDYRMRTNEWFSNFFAKADAKLGALPSRAVSPFRKLWDWLSPRLTFKEKASNSRRAKTITRAFVLSLKDYLVSAVDFVVLPKAFIPEKWVSETGPLFSKLEKNPDLVLSTAERALLQRYRATELFEKRRSFLKENPKTNRLQRTFSTFKKWVYIGVLATALNLTAHQADYLEQAVVHTEYVKLEQARLAPHQIQLLNETLPFPHLAVRIGKQVYNYGFTHMSVTHFEDYLDNHEFVIDAKIAQGMKPDWMDRVAAKHRVVQAVTLNLTVREVQSLQNYLRLQQGKTYKNITFVNDCSTMIARALRDHTSVRLPAAFDPSPGSVMAYFAAEETTEAFSKRNQIERLETIYGTKGQRAFPVLLRNFIVNFTDMRFYTRYFPYYGSWRLGMELKYDDTELQYWTPVELRTLEGWQTALYRSIETDPEYAEIRTWLKNADQIKAFGPESEHQVTIHEHFKTRYDELVSEMEHADTDFSQLVRSLYALQTLSDIEETLTGSTSFSLDDAFSDPTFAAELTSLMKQLSTDLKSDQR